MIDRFRIMVVDDDPDVRYVVSSLLGTQFETVEAQNGLDALEKFDRSEPDLLLMDISMPIMNGIACCQAIKRHPDFSSLPVMFLSAVSDPKVREQALVVGGVDYIEKPFETSALIATIQGYLEKNNVQPAEKSMSVAQLREVDQSPLQSAEDINKAIFAEDGLKASPEQQKEFDSGLTGGTRKKRVFGKKKEETQAPAVPIEDSQPVVAKRDERVDLPTPPLPDYKAVLKQRQLDEQARKEREEEEVGPKPLRPSAATPIPVPKVERSVSRDTVETPKPEKKSLRPAAASGPPPPSLSDAREVLAQRRVSALRKAGVSRPQSLKPRALVIVSDPKHLEIWNNGLKGVAEFLPLEDPVEAVELIARFQPDIIVLGIFERQYSGLQLAAMLRENPRLSHIQLLFVQSQSNTAEHISTAQRMTSNALLRAPLTDVRCRHAVDAVISQQGFIVREKKLPYGVYVKEVIQAAAHDRAISNKEREKQAYEDKNLSLKKFMAKELKDYKDIPAVRQHVDIHNQELKIK